MHSYISLRELRSGLDIKQKDSSDEQLLRVALAISRTIDRLCGRSFFIYEATRTYSPVYHDFLQIDDLLSVTSLKTDLNYDGTYEETWATTDYLLEPLNAPLEEEPYTRMRIKTGGTQTFPKRYENSVQITGKWGYWERLETVSATVVSAVSDTSKTITVSAAADIDTGNTLLIGDEQLFVRDLDDATGVASVERGANQSTPAAIDADETIQIYRYPEPITNAAQMMTNRFFARLRAPLGMINVPGDIGWRAIYVPKRDVDVLDMLRHYQRGSFFA